MGIGREPEAVRRGLIKQRYPGIERQAEIGVAEAGEQRPCSGRVASVSPGLASTSLIFRRDGMNCSWLYL
jgi:hypothetical protein